MVIFCQCSVEQGSFLLVPILACPVPGVAQEAPEDFPLERSLLLLASVVVFALGFWALQRAQLGGDPNDPAKVPAVLCCCCTMAW